MSSTKIDLSGATITGSNFMSEKGIVINTIPQTQIDWLGIRNDLKRLQNTLASAPSCVRDSMAAFSHEAETAAKQSDWERFKAAAKTIGSIGLQYLRDISVAVLAEVVAKAL